MRSADSPLVRDYQLEPSSTRVWQGCVEYDLGPENTAGGCWIAYPPDHDGGRCRRGP